MPSGSSNAAYTVAVLVFTEARDTLEHLVARLREEHVEALQYHGVPSELLVFPDENHWILKPRNIVAWYQAVLEFIARHLES